MGSCRSVCVVFTVTKEAKYKCDIYMVFDYAEHDLTGLMDATRHSTLRPDQVGTALNGDSGQGRQARQGCWICVSSCALMSSMHATD